MVNRFIMTTENAFLTPCPSTFTKIILGKKYLPMKEPHTFFDLEGKFELSNVFFVKTDRTIHVLQV